MAAAPRLDAAEMARNIALAGVKDFTAALHRYLCHLPGSRVEARLFLPGFVVTPLKGIGRVKNPRVTGRQAHPLCR